MTREDGVKGREEAREVRKANAAAAYADLAPMVAELRAEGLSLRQIANRLNAEWHATRTGKLWGPVQVVRVLERVGSAATPS